MSTGKPFVHSSDFVIRQTQATDLADLEHLGIKVTAPELQDEHEKLFTALNSNGVVIGFLRFKWAEHGMLWSDLVVNPNFLRAEFKLAILNLLKMVANPIKTAPGVIVGPWKAFVKEQAVALGYTVEEATSSRSKSLVLRF
ncbi:MAG: hypothetical protein JST80_03455 [Bdellovibrionales bacterium]|nr:hypothetical protein [Bdellovibrionales bacterium]